MACMKDRVAIITGGASGIGLAVASALAGEGVKLTLASRDERKLLQAAARLEEEHGAEILTVTTDVSDTGRVVRMVERTVEVHGDPDVLVNNAGILQIGSITEIAEEDWDRTLAVNLKGAFLCTRAVLPIMTRNRSGYIINIASVAGKTGVAGASAYSASKFGMAGFSESLLKEAAASGIKVTAICPAYVDTPMVAEAAVPADEMIPARDIARIVVDLLHLSPQTVVKEVVVERIGMYAG